MCVEKYGYHDKYGVHVGGHRDRVLTVIVEGYHGNVQMGRCHLDDKYM